MIIDLLVNGATLSALLQGLSDSILITLCMIGIACSASVLIGAIAPSILVGVIAVLYGRISSRPWSCYQYSSSIRRCKSRY